MNSESWKDVPAFLTEAMDEPGDAGALDVLRGIEGTGKLPPPRGQLHALLERAQTAPLRYAPFFRRVSELLGLSEQEVEQLLRPEGFKRAPLRGIRYKNSPRSVNQGQMGSVVRFEGGVRYPRHRHVHHERLLVLEGGYTDDSGRHFGPGDVHEMPPGSEHGFRVDADGPCLAVTVADERLQFTSPLLRMMARLIGR